MIILSWLSGTAGFFILALAMPRNRKILSSKLHFPFQDKLVRNAGLTLVGLDLLLICQRYAIAEGVVIWCYQLTVCALVVALTLTYRHNKAPR
ncbi:DUF3325 family protein [Neptunicella sp. SCSIO 80796]|uniref:DUF3325 family protein n=1 Tax=Neptunicella plasticusilytica TaxID=3117012 RepID=UPI003A4D9AA0